MRALMVSILALAALTGAAQAASDPWSPQISGLRLGAPLAPDNSPGSSGGYSNGTGGTGYSGGAWQFGNNAVAVNGTFYTLFQKGAFPFRR